MFCLNISYVNGTTNNNSCSWDNRNEIPCISIINNTPNSSKFSKPGINKIIQHRLYEKDFINKCNFRTVLYDSVKNDESA